MSRARCQTCRDAVGMHHTPLKSSRPGGRYEYHHVDTRAADTPPAVPTSCHIEVTACRAPAERRTTRSRPTAGKIKFWFEAQYHVHGTVHAMGMHHTPLESSGRGGHMSNGTRTSAQQRCRRRCQN